MKRFFLFFILSPIACITQANEYMNAEQATRLNIWIAILYTIIVAVIAGAALYIVMMRKQRKVTDEKIRSFIHTAHEIRTSLTLIKTSLEEIAEQEQLSKNGQQNVGTALRNVNVLLSLTANLVSSEHKDIHSDTLNMSAREINSTAGVPVNTSNTLPTREEKGGKIRQAIRQKILIVENDNELKESLHGSLSGQYDIQACSNGKQAFTTAKEYLPDLVITDITMPELGGDRLCHILKNDINTSHIPIILLTSLNTEGNIIKDLQNEADEYIVKPFNIGILRASIANLLANRMLLRHKYANLELDEDRYGTDCINCSTDLDWKFVSSVKKEVEANMEQPNFNVDVLCSLMNMSRTSFYNKIKALTDQAPADYVRLIRLKYATELLKEQKYSITEISEKTGFSDAKYFREVFKKHFNISPRQYAQTTR